MDNIKYSTKNLRPIAFISGVLLLVVFVVYFFDKPKDDYKPAVISNQPSSTWSQTIEINAGDVEPLPPVVQYPTHYHITANKPIYVTSTHAQRKRKIGSGEIVCLMQDIWNGREEAMITVEGIENQTTVKLGIFTEHTSSGILDQTKSKNLLEPRTTDENSPAVSVIDEQLIGRWLGEVNKKPAILIFSKQGESLKGKLTYDGIEETLSISIQEDPSQNEIILTLEGISYNRLRGRGNFYLDTFSGILKASSDQISGNFEDRAGTKGKWSVSKCINSPHTIDGEWRGSWERSGLWNPLQTNTGRFRLILKQNGDYFSGVISYENSKGSSKVDGQTCGDRISFEYSYTDGTVKSYIGNLSNLDRQAQGTWIQTQGSGRWEMTKVLK